MRPRLALVPGEPAGVGPELVHPCIAAATMIADIIVFGDRDTLLQARGQPRPADRVSSHRRCADATPGDIRLVRNPQRRRRRIRHARSAQRRGVIAALQQAAAACIAGEFDGLVTGPVHKATINAGGIAYTGTTELLARQAGRSVVMMLANDIVRVALATTHLPLREVADAITPSGLERTLRIVDAALREDFGIAAPAIAVLGLNPHAGEAGHLGREEIDIIEPLLERLRGEGMALHRPVAGRHRVPAGETARPSTRCWRCTTTRACRC